MRVFAAGSRLFGPHRLEASANKRVNKQTSFTHPPIFPQFPYLCPKAQKLMHEFIQNLPKAELHLHIEGSFEPELMFQIAQRNKIDLPFANVEEIRAAYNFNNLQEFLDIYYQGAQVLLDEQDFYDLTMAYLRRVHADNVIHADIMFDPQTHTDRGVAFDTVMNGIWRATQDAHAELGITTKLIMSFLRHLDEASALKTLEHGVRHKDKITSIGLDSSEVGNPPHKFANAFREAKEEGFKIQVHAGEEGPAEYVWEALNLLDVDRIDHGNRCLEDPKLVQELVDRQMVLTVCPLSNLKLCVVNDMKQHPLKRMLDLGLNVTVSSDDPAYFGGYMNDNFIAVSDALGLTEAEIGKLNGNALAGRW